MWKATISGLLARKVRLVLTATAVLLGVSFVSATYVLTDTVKAAFDGVFAQTLSGVDLQVQGQRPLGRGDPPRIPTSTLQAVRSVDGVARAEGFVTGYAQFVARDGASIGGGGPPTIGASWVDGGPFHLVPDGVSRPPKGPDEIAMDAATAHEHGFAVGDRVRCSSKARRASSRSWACSASATSSTSAPSPSPPSTSPLRRLRLSTPSGRSTGSTCNASRAMPRLVVQRRPRCRRLGDQFEVLHAHPGHRPGEASRFATSSGSSPMHCSGSRRSGCGRRVRDLQHVHDPRGATHPGAGAPACHRASRRQVVTSVVLAIRN